MPHDTTPERSDLVAFFTVLTVFFLVTVTGGVWALYKVRASQERHAKQDTGAVERASQHLESQRGALRSAPLPIERAMVLIAQKGRAASPLLAPTGDFERDPLLGWSAGKAPVTMGGVAIEVGEPAPVPPPTPSASPDAGASPEGGEPAP